MADTPRGQRVEPHGHEPAHGGPDDSAAIDPLGIQQLQHIHDIGLGQVALGLIVMVRSSPAPLVRHQNPVAALQDGGDILEVTAISRQSVQAQRNRRFRRRAWVITTIDC